ncbi:MAG TPA: hypothetical protein VKX41_22600 [Alloacidobacterium sp.]|jgi:hypothetical protein|nr:hypothetical protein [Alloacidobacterium sp.]
MSTKVLFPALALLLLFPANGGAQNKVNNDQTLSSSAKTKITNQLNESNRHSLAVFTDKGDETGSFPLDSARSAYSSSLKDYVLSVQSEEEKEGRASAKETYAKPIITCKDPKALDPPPPCVICKDGTILCSKASFGMRLTMDEDKLPKTQPQE